MYEIHAVNYTFNFLVSYSTFEVENIILYQAKRDIKYYITCRSFLKQTNKHFVISSLCCSIEWRTLRNARIMVSFGNPDHATTRT